MGELQEKNGRVNGRKMGGFVKRSTCFTHYLLSWDAVLHGPPSTCARVCIGALKQKLLA